jgi:hypothetical protein
MKTQNGRKTTALQDEIIEAVEPDRGGKYYWLHLATRDIT